MPKRLVSVIFSVILFLFISNSALHAAMRLYVSEDCGSCSVVLREGAEVIERLKDSGELEVVDVTYVETDLPALPALVDGERVVIGTGVLEYLNNRNHELHELHK